MLMYIIYCHISDFSITYENGTFINNYWLQLHLSTKVSHCIDEINQIQWFEYISI